jgi:hypothetical protein
MHYIVLRDILEPWSPDMCRDNLLTSDLVFELNDGILLLSLVSWNVVKLHCQLYVPLPGFEWMIQDKPCRAHRAILQ